MGFNQLNVILGAKIEGFDRAFRQAEKSLNRFSRQLEGIGRDLTTRLTLPLAGLGIAAVSAAADFDKLRKGLEVVAGSSEEAEKQFKRLQEIAKLPAVDFEQAVRGSIRLQGVGFAAEDAERSIAALAKVVALTGDATNLDSVINQLTQLSSKGKILNEDLQVILENAPALSGVLTEAFGGATAEAIRKTTTNTGEFVSRLIQAIESSEKFQNQQNNLSNSMDNVRQAFRASLATLGESISRALNLAENLNRVSQAVDSAAKGFSSLSPETQKYAVTLAAVAAAIGPVLIGIGSLVKVFPSLIATIRLGIGALTGPVGLLITGLTTLLVLLSKFDAEKFSKGLAGAQSQTFSLSNTARGLAGRSAGVTQDVNRGQSALAFAGVQNVVRGPLRSGFAGGTPTEVKKAGSDFISNFAAGAEPKAKEVGKIFRESLVPTGFELLPQGIRKAGDAFQYLADKTRPALAQVAAFKTSAIDVLNESISSLELNLQGISNQAAVFGTDKLTVLQQQIGAVTTALQNAVSSGFGPTSEIVLTLQALLEKLNKQFEQLTLKSIAQQLVTNALFEGFSNFFDAVAKGSKNAFKAITDAIKALILQIVKAIAVAAALGLILSALGFGSFGALFKTFAFQGLGIKPFAKGGLVTGPTAALIGEGPGTTRANPEVVAPLDKLQQILGNTQPTGFIASTRIDGNDLLVLIERAERNRNR